jgi:hypothetical protein
MKHAEIGKVYSWICSDNMQDIYINLQYTAKIFTENLKGGQREFREYAEYVGGIWGKIQGELTGYKGE